MIRLIGLTYYRIVNVRKPVDDISIREQEQMTTFPTGFSKQASLIKDAAFVEQVNAFSSLSPRLGSTLFSLQLRLGPLAAGRFHTVFARELVTANLQRNSHRS